MCPSDFDCDAAIFSPSKNNKHEKAKKKHTNKQKITHDIPNDPNI
jgi:hypothetical protein